MSGLQALPETHAVFLAESRPHAIGWIHILTSHSLITGPRAELAGLAVAPHAQGTGVGPERKEAHAFYLSRGYKRSKTQLALTKSI